MNNLRILIVIDSLGAGGAEKSTQVLCDFLFTNNVYFEIVCLDRKKVGVQDNMIEKGYKIHFLNTYSVLQQINFISNLIKSNNFSLVHSILFRSNLRVRMCKLKVSFLHIESLVNTTYSKNRFLDPRVNKYSLHLYKLIDRLTINKYTDHFHSITDTVKKHYIQNLKIPASKTSVIYRGRDAKVAAQNFDLKDLGFSDNDFIVVSTGRHEFQKGQLNLIKAINLVKERGYENIKLLILGREGNSTPSMKAYMEEAKLENTVKLAGYRSDVPAILSSCHLFAFPSLYEGLGGAVIEAQAAGLPIVCNDIDVLREVVIEGENAEFFNTNDINSIADKIILLYESKDKRIRYSKRSRQHFEENFDLAVINQKMLQLYKDLCSQQGKLTLKTTQNKSYNF